MATPVEAPKLGNTVEECLVAKWLKHKGDLVSAGETVAEIETDKATFEVTAPVGGTLLETFFAEGALAPVFTNLCVIGEPGENVEAFRPGLLEPASAAPEKKWGGPPGLPSPKQPDNPAPLASLSPRARRFAEEHGFHPASVAGSGPGGRVIEEDLRKLYYSPPRLSSAAKKRAEEGAEIRGEGSGTAGRVLASDLGPPPSPMSSIREKIARRMRESLAATSQYALHSSADASGLLALRKRVKSSAGAPDITIGDMAAFCAIKALLAFPELNAELIDGRIYQHAEVHLGVLVNPAVDQLGVQLGKLQQRFDGAKRGHIADGDIRRARGALDAFAQRQEPARIGRGMQRIDRKSTRLNSSHLVISYA